MPLIKINSKYQVTLPVSIRTKLGWHIGDQVHAYVDVDEEQERIVINKVARKTDEDAAKISIRERFQFTIPIKIYTKLCITEGDILMARVDNDSLFLFPQVLSARYYEPTPEPLKPKLLEQSKLKNKSKEDGLQKIVENSSKYRKKKRSDLLET